MRTLPFGHDTNFICNWHTGMDIDGQQTHNKGEYIHQFEIQYGHWQIDDGNDQKTHINKQWIHTSIWDSVDSIKFVTANYISPTDDGGLMWCQTSIKISKASRHKLEKTHAFYWNLWFCSKTNNCFSCLTSNCHMIAKSRGGKPMFVSLSYTQNS